MRHLLSISEFPIFRQNNKDESAEFKIAKVAVTNVLAFVVFLAGIGSKSSITPLVSQLPSFFAKVSTSKNLLFYFVTDTPGK
jgi:hypothetical protein